MNEFEQALNIPGAIIVKWCAFCNTREADAGTLNLEVQRDLFLDLPICTICVEQAQKEGFIPN